MLKSYLKTAVRNLYKNKFYSIINIAGLGTAMAICVVGYVNYQFSQSFDTFHENAENIYLVSSSTIENDEPANWSHIPMPLLPAIKKEIPGIERVSRVSMLGCNVIYGDKVFNERVCLVDDDFLEMFTFPDINGMKKNLGDKNSLLIDQKIALKYFGREDPVGKRLTINYNNHEFDFYVQDVIKNPPPNSNLPIAMVMPIENLEQMAKFDLSQWKFWTRGAFVQIQANASDKEIEAQLQEYLAITNQNNPDFETSGFNLTPLLKISSIERDLYGSIFADAMHPAAIIAPSVVALLVLLLACFNFINTSIAYSMRRVREIGIRKVMGGFRRHLIQQFLGENIVLCLMALLLAAALSEIFVPAYDSLWPELSLKMNYSENPGLIGFFVGLLLITAVGAGAYPAFYISSYRPINILAGTQKFSGKNPLIRLLLTLQLAIAMTAIASSVILSQNGKYIDEFDLGFDTDNILKVELEGEESYTLMRNALTDCPDIISMAGSRHLMNQFFSRTAVNYKGVKMQAHFFDVGDDFIETLGFQLKAGRTFDSQYSADADNAIIVSEAFASRFGWDSPVGQSFSFEESDSAKEYQVIGVIKNFYPNSVESRVLPTVLRMTLPERYEFLMIKSHPGRQAEVAEHVKTTWKNLFPNLPYSGSRFEDNFAYVQHVNNSMRLVCMYIAGMVLIISAMGIYALVSLNIIKRTKEFGIRKALGASMANISSLISRGLIAPIAIGGVFAAAMGYFLTDMLLSSIWAYYADFGILPFIFAPLMVVVITLLTIGFRVIKTARANPVEALRYE